MSPSTVVLLHYTDGWQVRCRLIFYLICFVTDVLKYIHLYCTMSDSKSLYILHLGWGKVAQSGSLHKSKTQTYCPQEHTMMSSEWSEAKPDLHLWTCYVPPRKHITEDNVKIKLDIARMKLINKHEIGRECSMHDQKEKSIQNSVWLSQSNKLM
jgi:hypothetical protein